MSDESNYSSVGSEDSFLQEVIHSNMERAPDRSATVAATDSGSVVSESSNRSWVVCEPHDRLSRAEALAAPARLWLNPDGTMRYIPVPDGSDQPTAADVLCARHVHHTQGTSDSDQD